jgi:hypothetical protein
LPFGGVIKDKDHVEDRIRRAQKAILNPKTRKARSLEYFLSGDIEETIELGFSTDYVSLQIYGPDIVDLSFVDLPGMSCLFTRKVQLG